MTEFRVTLADGTAKDYKFDDPRCSVGVNGQGQLTLHDGVKLVAAYGAGVWRTFDRVAQTPEPAWWPKGEGEA
jgi:hypothetical protein